MLALQHERVGEFAEAKACCEALLQQEPSNIDALHLMGAILGSQGDIEAAVDWLQKALERLPASAILHNQLGHALQRLGQFEKAEHHHQQALAHHPDYPEAHYHLANLFHRRADLHSAVKHYHKVIELDENYPEAHYNLGIVLLKLNELDAAAQHFQAVTRLRPDASAKAHFQLAHLHYQKAEYDDAEEAYSAALLQEPLNVDAYTNLGAVHLKKDNLQEAILCFANALRIDEKHIEARNNLAATLMEDDRYPEAAWHYQELLKYAPNDAEAHYNLGVAFMMMAELEQAQSHLTAAIKLQPLHLNAHSNLGAIALRQQHREEALSHYLFALKIDPDNSAIRYSIAALTGAEAPLVAPLQYVKNLFDNYARHFEQHVTDVLRYQVPGLLYQAVIQCLENEKKQDVTLDVLDIGCGTGLSGAAFYPLSKHMVGIDVSSRMLAEARKKTIYAELHEGNLTELLPEYHQAFDLIVAAEVFVYFGDLTSLFQQCYEALRKDGLLAFSVECGLPSANNSQINQLGYGLQVTARYAHTDAYIHRLALDMHYKIISHERAVIRLHDDKPLEGSVWVLQRL